jgi:alkanesulfonate monooxygenase SsuD/methylene tetrahydromethanopterin reductase-like flavin-dependent oxidoreductase (luciferase family)
MKFGIFYEHQLPRPWSADSEYRLLHESLAQIELADGLGYDYAWEVEHHFLEAFGSATASFSFRPTTRSASPSGWRRSTS